MIKLAGIGTLCLLLLVCRSYPVRGPLVFLISVMAGIVILSAPTHLRPYDLPVEQNVSQGLSR